jgi:NAD(P)H-dependent FMN reductase
MTTLVAFSGSTRSASFHTRLLNSLPAYAPDGTAIALFDLAEVPFYNQDLEGEALPASVAALRAAVAEADGVIFAAPEYNGSYSALTKNTIDWLSRPMGQGVLREKKVMVISATPGPGGGARITEQIVAVLGFFGNTVVGTVNASTIHEKMAADGDVVTDVTLADQLRAALAAF